jgi:hypothetical protein
MCSDKNYHIERNFVRSRPEADHTARICCALNVVSAPMIGDDGADCRLLSSIFVIKSTDRPLHPVFRALFLDISRAASRSAR